MGRHGDDWRKGQTTTEKRGRGRVVGNGAAGFPQQQENLDGPSNTASKPKLSVMLELEPWAAFLWVLLGVFSCLIQSCSCRLQQISAQMDLIGTRRRGAGPDKIWWWGSVSDLWWALLCCLRRSAAWRSGCCRLTSEARRPSSAPALLQANRSNASIAGGSSPSNNEALPPAHHLLFPTTTTETNSIWSTLICFALP
jgi:hypothetical protein